MRPHAGRTAIVDAAGAHAYRELLARAAHAAGSIQAGRADLRAARVALLIEPGARWVQALLGIWQAGGIAVPLCASHPEPELAHVLDDSTPESVIADATHAPRVRALAHSRGMRCIAAEELDAGPPAGEAEIAPERRALIVYTSGTTGKPKGAVHTHHSLLAQVDSLRAAWEWHADDRILHCLPLHHVHGIVNAMLCALASGACCELLPRFAPGPVWERLSHGGITLLMAVPTMYAKLATTWERSRLDAQSAWSAAARALRLMVSGSAALPVPLFERWRAITGQTLLERYGMTEIGMALGNPLRGERVPGTVGVPLPGVEVRLAGADGNDVAAGTAGEVEVRGPGVFLEYWGRPAATAAAFRDGWFRTGDTAIVEQGRWRLLGRTGTDFIKSGGYKVAALEVEEALRAHPAVADCAVAGVPDPEWGERVAVAVVARAGTLDLAALRAWAKEQLAPYKVPALWTQVEALPRNALGKVLRDEVRRVCGG